MTPAQPDRVFLGWFLVFYAYLAYDFMGGYPIAIRVALPRGKRPEGVTMIGKLGLPELLVILFIALLIFGPKKIGELGKGLGEGIRNFKSGLSDDKPEAKNSEAKDSEAKK